MACDIGNIRSISRYWHQIMQNVRYFVCVATLGRFHQPRRQGARSHGYNRLRDVSATSHDNIARHKAADEAPSTLCGDGTVQLCWHLRMTPPRVPMVCHVSYLEVIRLSQQYPEDDSHSISVTNSSSPQPRGRLP